MSDCLDCIYYTKGASRCAYYAMVPVPIAADSTCDGRDVVAGRLWAHLVAKHAIILSPEEPYSSLIATHRHEHAGPGTIRNHPISDRTYTLRAVGTVLAEDDS